MADDDRGPGASHHGFVLMEALLDKLKILNCDHELLEKHKVKPLSRHFFVSSPHLPHNPGEQFYAFTVTAAWLINAAGRSFAAPQEDDEPGAAVADVLAELRALGVKVDFAPSKLKSGSGEHVCFVLNALAEHALKRRGFSFKRPKYPTETTEEESAMADHAELTLCQTDGVVEDDDDDDYEEEDENPPDLEPPTPRSTLKEAAPTKPEGILRTTVDAAAWNLEVERVLPVLKVTIRTDNKDWRVHVDQMHRHQDGIKSSLREAKGFLEKLQDDISRTLEKASSREKYVNKQLEGVIAQHGEARDKLSEVQERYRHASGGVAQRTRLLAELSEELEKVKQEMEERGSSVSDAAALVKIKQSVTKLKQETARMDVRAGVVRHVLLQAKLKRKSNLMSADATQTFA
ncbi:intraflagellar transport protein 57 homolog [Syngnathoides biaculeatus]|uniref:intraflagellar transport protein 57 homolog n=1 Tax=Syngnathoides biaculeatus TaxID=300417 RepID=UPI002ADDA4A1|nr:intraflagellar transport protein 57 homolog [Syngnathoides biaculeatus]